MNEQMAFALASHFPISAGKMGLLSLEHPFFALANKDMSVYKYESNDGTFGLEISPGIEGRATIKDCDFIIYLIAKLVAMKKAGELNTDTPVIHVEASEFLNFAKRGDGGKNYKDLRAMLKRLGNTNYTITTKSKNGDKEETRNRTWIDPEWNSVREKQTKHRELITFEVRPREWWVRTIRETNQYLTVPQDFFTIRQALDRRYWQIARMHASSSKPFLISWEKFYNKIGSETPFDQFRSRLRRKMKLTGSVQVLDYFITEVDGRMLQITEAPSD